MEKSEAIGVFDSGIGGLTVLKELVKVLPTERYIYFADTKNLPYGKKTKEQLIGFVRDIFDWYKKQNVKAVVMACNTTSAVAYEFLKSEYDFKIYPLIQTLVNEVSKENYKKIGVLATEATVKSKAYFNEFKKRNPNTVVEELACPEWVDIIENYDISQIKENQEMLNKIKLPVKTLADCDKIILGCTHYPLLENIISTFEEKSKIINPAIIFSDSIKKDLRAQNLCNNSELGLKFCVSADTEAFESKLIKLGFDSHSVDLIQF